MSPEMQAKKRILDRISDIDQRVSDLKSMVEYRQVTGAVTKETHHAMTSEIKDLQKEKEAILEELFPQIFSEQK